MRLGSPAVAPSGEEHSGEGVWWELCTNMGQAVWASCSVSRAARSVSFPCTAPQEERTEGELVACLHRAWLLQEPPQPAVTVGRHEGEVCVLSCLLARRNACAWGLLHALLPC